jgi:coenzyme F420 biosynthesis associated uncharacterized protein
MRLPVTGPYGGSMPNELIDWDLAAATARRLVPPGPAVSHAEAADVVAALRDLTVEAETHVRQFTGLAADLVPGPPAVVDRPGWITNNIEGFRIAIGPVLERVAERQRARTGGAAIGAVGSRITGLQVGSILAFLASKVLGQYEIFLPPEQGPGRLSLIAPNIVATERALDVDPRDFRLWVCLHESTHRTQFTAVSWMRDHFLAEIDALGEATDLDPSALLERLRAAAGSLRSGNRSLIEIMQTPQQRAVIDRLTGLMSLLEGHAEYVMDGVGPDVVPTVATIRSRFDQRRGGGSPIQRLLRKLLGVDLKLKQYADGNRFVTAVVEAVGRDGFDKVWESPETLPSRAEVTDPRAWLERVHGIPFAASA